MKTAIYIADLYSENAHLMPWRVPLEVQRNWQGKEAPEIWSGRDISSPQPPEIINEIPVYPVPRIKSRMESLAARIRERNCELLFFPVAFYHCYHNAAQIEQQTGCRIAWYLPGGWYSIRQCFRALKYMNFKSVLPYLVQAAFPKKKFFRALSQDRNRAFVCFSDYSARKVAEYYPKEAVFTALPGLDKSEQDSKPVKNESNPPYFLFFGPPSPIRGSQILVRAFEELVKAHPECRLHLCIRSDRNADASGLLNRIKNSPAFANIDVRKESLSKDALQQEIAGCIAVVKPFLIVPSEIPLAVIESVQYGKPVLASGPDGTGDFASQFGLVSRHGDSHGLFRNMQKILEDGILRKELSGRAIDLASRYPDWSGNAAIWKTAGSFQ